MAETKGVDEILQGGNVNRGEKGPTMEMWAPLH